MNTRKDELVNPRRRLPELKLPAIQEESPKPIRAPGRRSSVVLLLHGTGCRDCGSYVGSLAELRANLAEWDGRVVVVVPYPAVGGPAPYAAAELPFLVVTDPEDRLTSALSMEVPALVIADQWGEIYLAHEAGADHRFPAPEEVVDWTRFLAIQCPECEGEAL